ncbi:MAG: hypothetical protein M1405_00655 [Patescibacteria group bacterium]|nr:hypothetical protein [Patescibacteria group bacterium]
MKEFILIRWKLLLFIALLLFSLFSSVLILTTASKYNWDYSLSLLANQFIHKHISIAPANDMPLGDISTYHGKFYLYFGPLASIILMPFVLVFGKNFPQVILGILSAALSFYAIYSISKHFKFNKVDSLFLSLFFVFSTVLLSSSLINISAYQVEVLAVPFILLSLNEYFSKKRPLLIGIFLGLAVMTRVTLILAALFFVFEYLQKRFSLKQLILFFVPLVLFLLITGGYDFVRFHSFFDTGYTHSIALNTFPLSRNLQYGYMSLSHLPANLYSFLVMPPQPLLTDANGGFVFKFPFLKASPWGIAIWYTSPLFLYLLFKFRKAKYTVSALLTAIIISIPLLTYFSIGFAQFGYRYSLDFLPFLFLLLIPSLLPKLSKTAVFLIALGVIFNCIYTTSLWGVYPLFGIH